jgi:hypothetical protein
LIYLEVGLLHFLRIFLQGYSLPIDDEVELISIVALINYEVIFVKYFLFKCICDLQPLIRIHGGQNVDTREEGFVLRSLSRGCILHDVVEGVPVQSPNDTVALSKNGCRSRCVIEKCQLSKAITWLVVL